MQDYKFDRLIVGSDHSYFLNFVPIVSKAWRTLFPSVKLTLAYVTSDSSLMDELKNFFDDVIVYEPVNGAPTANLAKIARRYACTQYEDEVCMIEDLDTAPLRADCVINYAKQRRKNTIGLVGKEVYYGSEHYGKVPSSNTVAESYIWEKVINPNHYSFEEWVQSLKGMKIYDHKEDPYANPNFFSDESLMRALISHNKIDDESITHIIRTCNPHIDWIDRSWWSIDHQKLKNHGYTFVNFMRPIDERARPVVEHIFNELSENV